MELGHDLDQDCLFFIEHVPPESVGKNDDIFYKLGMSCIERMKKGTADF